VLNKYEKSRGQLLGPRKCSLLIGKKMLGGRRPSGGLDSGQPVKEKLKNKLSDYVGKYLSSGAKEVMIKLVI
jgi:hypothetical protein